MIVLVDYQDKAVKKSLKEIQEILDSTERVGEVRKFLLQAPTGSGKTVMASSIVSGLAGLEDRDFAFVFIAPNTLHTQSKSSFEQHLEGENVMFLDNLPIGALEKNSILFLNWSSVNKKTNKIVSGDENGRTVSEVVTKTKNNKREIILIIDESHHSAGSTISQEFINTISPRLIFEITATPKHKFVEEDFTDKVVAKVTVKRPAVVEAGMVCQSAVFSQDYEKHQQSFINKFGRKNPDPNEVFIWAALQERIQFEEVLTSESDKNTPCYVPAVGIQLPSEGKADKDTKEELSKVNEIITFLEHCGVQPNEIAVYLSGRKENMDEKNIPVEGVKVVIFKTAIAIGWDFPRLKIGALLRDTKTKSFAVQTLGRWMRQPEHKQYANEYLNSAYFYTDVKLMPKVAKGEGMELKLAKTATIRENYRNSSVDIKLTSFNRLSVTPVILDTGYFARHWVKELRTSYAGEASTISGPELFSEMGFRVDNKVLYAISNIDKLVITDIDSDERDITGTVSRILSNSESEKQFDTAIGSILKEYNVSNVDNIINHILTTIARVTKLGTSDVARISMSKGLLPFFEKTVVVIAERFKSEHPESFANQESFVEVQWTPTEVFKILYTHGNEPSKVSTESRYLYDYAGALGKEIPGSSDIEKAYFKYLESSSTIKWFIKNGSKGGEFLSYPYKTEIAANAGQTKEYLFYPDWIICRENGDIELHDTKDGSTLTDQITLDKLKSSSAVTKRLSEKDGIAIRVAIVKQNKDGTFSKSREGVTTLAERDKDNNSNWEPIF